MLYDAEPMDLTTHSNVAPDLLQMLGRSQGLEDRIFEILGDDSFDGAPRSQAAVALCLVSLEHGQAVQALMSLALAVSAVGLVRLQFEALTRAMWLLYAAPDSAVDKMLAPLSKESEQAAKNLPGASDMIDDLVKKGRAPAVAHQMLSHFKEVSWPALNSFVHGGVHALSRSADGFPTVLALQLLRNSNGLTTMTGMTLAVLTGDQLCASAMSRIQREFADCLPQLLEHPPVV